MAKVRPNFAVFLYRPITEMDDSDDIAFWQSRSDNEKFDEAWRLVLEACQLQGINRDELRFQRSVATLQRQER